MRDFDELCIAVNFTNILALNRSIAKLEMYVQNNKLEELQPPHSLYVTYLEISNTFTDMIKIEIENKW